MIGNDKYLKSICKNYHLVENYIQARFDVDEIWDLHHKNEIIENKSAEELKLENRYFNVDTSDLIFIKHKEHMRIHHICGRAVWCGKKPWNYNKDLKSLGYDTSIYGHNFTEEQKKLISRNTKAAMQREDIKQKVSSAQKERFSKQEERDKISEKTKLGMKRDEVVAKLNTCKNEYKEAKRNGYSKGWNSFQSEFYKNYNK